MTLNYTPEEDERNAILLKYFFAKDRWRVRRMLTKPRGHERPRTWAEVFEEKFGESIEAYAARIKHDDLSDQERAVIGPIRKKPEG